MRGVFDDEQSELLPARHQRDRELTLSPMLLVGLFFGMALLCGLCFGLGYKLGNRGSQAAAQQPGVPAPWQVADAQSKPAAALPGAAQPQINADNLAVSAAESALPESAAQNPSSQNFGSQNSGASAIPAANLNQWVVQPALPTTNSTTNPAQTPASVQPVASIAASAIPAPAPRPSVQAVPAAPPALALMVQIATVTRRQDAEALVSALRQRGYAVSVRLDEADGQFHVRIGPFRSLAEAGKWRQKLLNDGYNAIVQP